MSRLQRYLFAVVLAVVLMILADLLLVYLELPQWVRLPMMAILGLMTGVEIRNWLQKHGDLYKPKDKNER